jgi:hypothetical protein
MTWEGLLSVITARDYESLMLPHGIGGLPADVAHTAGWIWSSFLGIGVPLGLLGFFTQLQTAPRVALGMGLIFAANLAFFGAYGAGDKQLMFAPTLALWSIWIASGTRDLTALIARHAPALREHPVNLLALGLPVVALLLNFGLVDLSNDYSARERGEAILTEVQPDALIAATWWVDVGILRYLREIEGVRTDTTFVHTTQMEPADLHTLLQREIIRRSVYWLDEEPPRGFVGTPMANVAGLKLTVMGHQAPEGR